jgi:hypothetical protein
LSHSPAKEELKFECSCSVFRVQELPCYHRLLLGMQSKATIHLSHLSALSVSIDLLILLHVCFVRYWTRRGSLRVGTGGTCQ